MSKYFELKAKRMAKVTEYELLRDQIKMLNVEIELRKNQVSKYTEQISQLVADAAKISDEILGIEYEGLTKNWL